LLSDPPALDFGARVDGSICTCSSLNLIEPGLRLITASKSAGIRQTLDNLPVATI